MNTRSVSTVSVAVLFALTATASAGLMILTNSKHIAPAAWATNGFSKKVENHAHSMTLFTTYYNFVRIHKTLRITPAMAAGVTHRPWEVSDIAALLEANETKPAKRGAYRKKEAA